MWQQCAHCVVFFCCFSCTCCSFGCQAKLQVQILASLVAAPLHNGCTIAYAFFGVPTRTAHKQGLLVQDNLLPTKYDGQKHCVSHMHNAHAHMHAQHHVQMYAHTHMHTHVFAVHACVICTDMRDMRLQHLFCPRLPNLQFFVLEQWLFLESQPCKAPSLRCLVSPALLLEISNSNALRPHL